MKVFRYVEKIFLKLKVGGILSLLCLVFKQSISFNRIPAFSLLTNNVTGSLIALFAY